MLKNIFLLAVCTDILVGANEHIDASEDASAAPESKPLIEQPHCDLDPKLIGERAPLYRMLIDKLYFSEQDDTVMRTYKAESWIDVVDTNEDGQVDVCEMQRYMRFLGVPP